MGVAPQGLESVTLLKLRLIPRLDIKGPNLVKGIHLEGLRVMGDPQEFSRRYYEEGADELIYIDIVASLYGRNNLTEIVSRTATNVFIPITVGGGVRSVEDVNKLLRAGADKVAINTIEAKQIAPGRWEAYTDNGREKTGVDVLNWAKRSVELGAGEILLTSVDREGTRKGFDVELVRTIAKAVSVPVIACGGMGKIEHLVSVIRDGCADAVAMADVLHYKRLTLAEIRSGRERAALQAENQ
jgi:cyclase